MLPRKKEKNPPKQVLFNRNQALTLSFYFFFAAPFAAPLLPAEDLLSVLALDEGFSPFADFAAPLDLAGFFSPDLLALLVAVELLAVEDFAEEDLPPLAPPDFEVAPVLLPVSVLSANSPIASAATLSAETAAPVAAPIKISPATSLAVSRIGDELFFVCFGAAFFAAPPDLAVEDLAGVAFFVVSFVVSFLAAISFPLFLYY
jgi:hypothetical protein